MCDKKTGDNIPTSEEERHAKRPDRPPLSPGTKGYFDPFRVYAGREGSHTEFDEQMMKDKQGA